MSQRYYIVSEKEISNLINATQEATTAIFIGTWTKKLDKKMLKAINKTKERPILAALLILRDK